jgi:hypothetical protein
MIKPCLFVLASKTAEPISQQLARTAALHTTRSLRAGVTELLRFADIGPKGIRLRHSVNGNSVKLYNKQGSVLRVEATIVKPGDFKVYRPDPEGRLKWQRLRLGGLICGGEVRSVKGRNIRYLKALASVTGSTPFTSKPRASAVQCSLKGNVTAL